MAPIELATETANRIASAKSRGWEIRQQFGFWYAQNTSAEWIARNGCSTEGEDALAGMTVADVLERIEDAEDEHSAVFEGSVVQLNPLPARFRRG